MKTKNRWPEICSPNGAAVMLIRPKDETLSRDTGSKQSPFTFRRIQARELYQPSQSESNGRMRFRIRVQALGRAN